MKNSNINRIIVFMSLLLIFNLLDFLPGDIQNKDGLKRKKVEIEGRIYNVEWSDREFQAFCSNNQRIFSCKVEDPDKAILGFDYSTSLDSFVVFVMRSNYFKKGYDLVLEGSDFTLPLFEDLKEPVYTPIILEDYHRIFILYITESFSIKVYDFNKKCLIKEIKFTTPIFNLSKNSKLNLVQFLLFKNGSYKEYFIKIDEILANKYRVLPLISGIEDEKMKIKRAAISLDYEKLVGFGDSITRGWLYKKKNPELGYIPRLENLLNYEFDRGVVINEGIGAENTSDAVDRFEWTILTHRGKYLLFHEGINDAGILTVPVSLVVYNITYMISTALDYGIQPIASTLIPKDPNHPSGQGIKRQRAIDISKGIRSMAFDLGVSYIDFWKIFSNYPESDGGYYSLMSDNVHPSEKGYQLMAEEWLKAYKNLVPEKPRNVEVLLQSPQEITIEWSENMEMDFSQYRINFGYLVDNLGRQVMTSTNRFTFIRSPLLQHFFTRLYLKVQTVDSSENASDFSPVIVAEFKNQNQFFYNKQSDFYKIIETFIF